MKRGVIICISLLFLSQDLYSQLLIPQYQAWAKNKRPRYIAQIDFDWENMAYSGKERIEFVYPFQTNKGVILRLFANTGSSETQNMEILSVKSDKRPLNFRYLDNTTVLIEGDFNFKTPYNLNIEFKAALPEILEEGNDISTPLLFQVLTDQDGALTDNNYGVFGCSNDVCNIASILPTLAKVFEENWSVSTVNGVGDYQRADLSDFIVEIIHPQDVTFVSNGLTTSRELLKNGKVKSRFIADMVNDFVCEASSSFNFIKRDTDGIRFISYYISETYKAVADRALRIASDSVSFFSKYLSKYPYSELKIVQAPMTGGAGGVEFPALITVGSFLYELVAGGPGAIYMSKDIMDELFEFVVVHEVAHQWFSTLIPSDSRREPYLDEGLASLSALLYIIHKYGEEKGKVVIERQIKMNYLIMRLMGSDDMPINTPIEDYENIFQYAGIIYGKAPLFFLKLREIIGVERFRSLLSNWVKERVFRDSNLSQFIGMLKNNEPTKADEIERTYKRWMEGRYGDEDIGRVSLKDLLKYISGGKDLDIDISLGRIREWLEETFEMFRQYR